MASCVIGAVTALVPGSGYDAGPAPGYQAPPVRWQACPVGVLGGADPAKFDCAGEPVPIDYAHPGGGTIGLAMLRRKADDPAHRIGSLFLNPGGPGGSGLRLPLIATKFLST